jgi:uncharacterized protein (TIGR03084 family)
VEVLTDLFAEQDALDAVVAGLDHADWRRPTPSPGWTVADQIGHLTYFDRTAALAISDPEGFVAHRNDLITHFAQPDDAMIDTVTLGEFRSMAPGELLAAWREGRRALATVATAATAADPDARIEWYGPSMKLTSFLTARLMECWAHGQDIVDTIDTVDAASATFAARPATDRLRHIAQLGVITRGWSYRVRGLDVPAGEVRVALTAPSGGEWTWGPDDAADSITGPAEDFCLVVTQRRHVDDTGLVTTGPLARDWMEIAQAFAGGATDGPPSRRQSAHADPTSGREPA